MGVGVLEPVLMSIAWPGAFGSVQWQNTSSNQSTGQGSASPPPANLPQALLWTSGPCRTQTVAPHVRRVKA